MKKRLFLIGAGLLILLLLAFGSHKLMNSRTFQLFGGLTSEIETTQKVVAITFDDGPTEKAEDILSLLEQFNAKATFFLIGNDMEKFPEAAAKIAEAGHQIGNHTFSHSRMVLKSPAFIREEIEKTDQLIRQAGYTGEIDFRPPNGKKLIALPFYLDKQNRDTIMWNLEPDSYYTHSSDKVKYVKENIKPGSIILMHPWYDDTGEELKALEGILQTLTNEGYTFVTVNELQDL